jgi:hypothetical protein
VPGENIEKFVPGFTIRAAEKFEPRRVERVIFWERRRSDIGDIPELWNVLSVVVTNCG